MKYFLVVNHPDRYARGGVQRRGIYTLRCDDYQDYMETSRALRASNRKDGLRTASMPHVDSRDRGYRVRYMYVS